MERRIGDWDDGERDADTWERRAASAIVILAVDIEEVLVFDHLRMTSGCDSLHHEDLLRHSWNSLLCKEPSLLQLCGVDVVSNDVQVEMHLFLEHLRALSFNRCEVFVLKHIEGPLPLAAEHAISSLQVELLDNLKFDLTNLAIATLVVDLDLSTCDLISEEDILGKVDVEGGGSFVLAAPNSDIFRI